MQCVLLNNEWQLQKQPFIDAPQNRFQRRGQEPHKDVSWRSMQQ